MRLLKIHDRVLIIKGDHAGVIGWVQSIEVELTQEVKALVAVSVELSRPYGEVVKVLPSMIVHSDQFQSQIAA